MNWTDGYVTDTEYVYDYQQELNPLRQRLLCLASGFAIPKPKVACELGFGQGLSINIHAAASAVGWWGTGLQPCPGLLRPAVCGTERTWGQVV